MLTKRVRIQVVAFVVIALVGVSYVGARYVGLDRLFGGSGYTVHLRLDHSGGIFTNAEVTYRGVAIGRVGDLTLLGDGIEVDLLLDPDAPVIPASVQAVVANRSAVGEQYVDLRPTRDGEPYLADGSIISSDRAQLPLPTETVLRNLDRLVESVPREELRTVVDEMYLATEGAGPALQALLDSSAEFTKMATEYLPQTTALITDAGTVLTTQVETSESIKGFAEGSKLIAEQLVKSDGDLRTVLQKAPGAAEQISGLLAETGPNLGIVLANLLTTSNVLVTRQAGIEQMLVVTPKAVAAARDVIRPDGAHFGLATTFFTPLPCTAGYGGTRYRNGLDTSGAPLNTDARCTLAPGAGNVRGSQNVPRGGVPPAVKPFTYGATATVPQPRPAPAMTDSVGGLLGLEGSR
ncbi:MULTISPECIES: MCE family protein [Actinokineospora]|uniref:ABC transporter substrate-binding protein n=1 Tax=Actinokineospora fastidiosa TaxID=1816 RepID=A0A918GN65_9PSEU|nr:MULTISPECIES: MlaD family protein [Actinokineospora]UVS78918.1 virulence factor Mce family protein [Actinokineospora sp. UTMC 2448]GGS48172.1 ABC transporter substrate-binding protein [Actinokineospora fastidiosa]